MSVKIADSNPAKSMDVRLLCFMYAVGASKSATRRSLFRRGPNGCVK
jgi:hypothetical protein